ncbi:MAG: class III extradiol ring-cleavage dioxygenase [Alicyclobacillaceae bacterium]|nr:class III extradiol ring-cleavage dioxygenase [Alicyclobacillaceae bacterium]
MKQPSLFLAHGAPTLVLEHNPYTDFLQNRLSEEISRPTAIVLFTAHFESQKQLVSSVSTYTTLYDFVGFPPKLYHIQYPAKGDVQLADRIVQAFRTAGVEAAPETSRGLDHGAWTVLRLMYPEADIPVVQLSVNPHLSNAAQYAIGKILEPLRNDGILIIGSGGTTHNLRALSWDMPQGQSAPWVEEWESWLGEKVTAWDMESLFDYEDRGPHAKRAVPRNEHFIPLLLAMGSADEGRRAQQMVRFDEFGSLALTAWKFS